MSDMPKRRTEMIKIVYGDDRKRAEKNVKRQLGDKYEVVEGESLTLDGLVNLMNGNSLFDETRNILIKDFGENPDGFAKICEYVNTKNNVVVWESKLDKRSVVYKKMKEMNVELVECKLAEPMRNNEVFDIFDLAMRGDGKKAAKLIEKIEKNQDAYAYIGLLTTQALKRYETKQGNKEKLAIKMLAELDMQTKSSQVDPWELVKIFIWQISLF